MNRVYESGNLLRLLNIDSLTINSIYERKNKLYVATENEVIIFDIYGAYYSTIHNQSSTIIGIEDNSIYSFSKSILKAYNTKTFEEQEINTNLSKEAIIQTFCRAEKNEASINIAFLNF